VIHAKDSLNRENLPLHTRKTPINSIQTRILPPKLNFGTAVAEVGTHAGPMQCMCAAAHAAAKFRSQTLRTHR
jgi:hypothetical protein